MCSTDVFLGLLGVLLPPLPVWVKRGVCSADSIINILLCMLGYIPGLLHAWYIIAKYPEPPYDYEYQRLGPDAEQGRIYVFVHHGGPCPQPQPGAAQPKPQGPMNYGTNYAAGSSAAPPQQHHHQPQEQGTTSAAGPSDNAPPPSYAQVVAGDHKIQTQD
ncbi:df95b655-9349-42a4-aadb-b6810b6df47d [Thermothielavioides terrestris]|uniref:Stress response RCI peptide n=2 Tax=Thermothielavioides terrestris TaxID=2587410 RepID=G2R121_THETT|nr:uncharacterized protein THITE_2066420 [Thermothielavioides terrestris NRRL 8126]AEO66518.1 hypothetical protein THITE_2066420 [Thermothielavioides terrestris NRRL 8126]SPQ20249.1 df95b655-9349-42a4-aadb-b6810b6df47d [Thermothielavioides terrestris]